MVGDNQVQAILARFRENGGNGVGDEVLKFVNVEVKIFAFAFGQFRAAQSGHLQFGHDDEAEQFGVDFAGRAFGQIDEQDFLLVHHVAEIKAGFLLTHDIAHHFIFHETSDFGYEIAQHFRLVKVGSFGHFFFPEGADDRIFQFNQIFFDILVVGKHARNIYDRTRVIYIGHQGQHHIAHIVFKHRADHFRREKFVKNGNHFLHREILLVFGFGFQHIEAHRPLPIGRIKYNHIVHPIFGNMSEDVFHQIAVRVHDTDAVSVLNVLNGQIA